MGFFAWIRDGVRRAVLMGFSDAVTEIGARKSGEDLSPQLALALQDSLGSVEIAEESTPKLASAGPAPRKRLGRSLEQLRDPKAA